MTKSLELSSKETTSDLSDFQESKRELGSHKRRRFQLEDFDLGRTLGTGSFGRVRFAKFRNPPHGNDDFKSSLAMKILKKETIKKLNQIEHIKSERQLLDSLMTARALFQDEDQPWNPTKSRHPFIVRLFGAFQSQSYLFMVLEFIRGGEFFCHLRMHGHFKNKEATFYAASVGSVLAFLHRQDIVYRDLKPENLLLDHEGYVKVVDFGFAKKIPDNKTYTLCGTPEYIAPEVLLNQGHGKGVDWWGLGILTYEMLSGVAPFTDPDPMSVYQKIVRGAVQYPVYFDPDARSFLRRLLVTDVKKRYGCLAAGPSDVLRHRWLQDIDYSKLLARQLAPPLVPETNGEDDTSCFEEYTDEGEKDFAFLNDPPIDEDEGTFPHFDVVCI